MFKKIRKKLRYLLANDDQQAMLMAAISDAVLAVDLLGQPIFYNSRFAIMCGDVRLSKRRIWKLFNENKILQAFQKALKEGETITVEAVLFNLPTGRYFYSASIAPLKRKDGEIFGAIGLFHDVTDLKKAEQMRIDFVANVSHELRTPLTAIKGYTDTLLADVKDGKAIETGFLEVIGRNSARLMSLINDLLDLSVIESTDVLHRTKVKTDELTARVLRQFESKLAMKEQQLAVHYGASEIKADADRIEQVLANLLDNANKYTPAGGKIQVSWLNDERAIRLEVSNSGPAIPQEHHERLFERFYRVDKARSREMGGTGLGLAIVKHIMERHGGSVRVASSSGEGTKFICKLPN